MFPLLGHASTMMRVFRLGFHSHNPALFTLSLITYRTAIGYKNNVAYAEFRSMKPMMARALK